MTTGHGRGSYLEWLNCNDSGRPNLKSRWARLWRYSALPDPRNIIRDGETIPAQVAAMFSNFAMREPDSSRKPRIALGLTLMREVDSKAFLQWVTVLRNHWWPGPTFHARNAYVVQARNEVLRQAFADEGSWDALLFWDADQVLPVIGPGPLS